MRLITFDVEIAESPDAFPDGWASARDGRCGLASLVLFDTDTERYHVYDRSTLVGGIDHLNASDLLVSFNGLGFDTGVINAIAELDDHSHRLRRHAHYDILAQLWAELGGRRYAGWGLGAICERTFGLSKNGDGKLAPELYKEGRFAELIDYNINDVHLTRKLYNHLCDGGALVGPAEEQLHLQPPKGARA